jgi:type VI secretion system secreted protein VgrG
VQLQGIDAFEVYDYPGGFRTKDDGDKTTGRRMEEQETEHKFVEGAGVCRSFSSGHKFDLEDHFRRDTNGSYVLTMVQHSASAGSNYTGGMERAETYSNTFCCIPSAVPYRPPLSSGKPVIHGLQTAIVVGPSGEEIYADKYGRVKVQFHWDRNGKYDEKSSCWIRVSTAAAGKRWGSVLIPRVGWEVVVGFEEGDPDRPLIVGSVYNATQLPPYALPDEKTKSTLKSYSSKGGGGFNEIRIEDKKGNEQLFVHGEKDLHIRIKNDVRETILNERHIGIKMDQFTKIGGDNHIEITGDQNQKVNGSVSLKGGMDVLTKAGMKFAADAGTEIHLKAGTTLVIESGASLTLKVGGNYINLNPGGIFITGTMVMINSGGAAGSGSGCSPQRPKAPKEADTAEAGSAIQVPAPKSPPQVKTYSPAALVLKKAAAEGTPFCDMSGS